MAQVREIKKAIIDNKICLLQELLSVSSTDYIATPLYYKHKYYMSFLRLACKISCLDLLKFLCNDVGARQLFDLQTENIEHLSSTVFLGELLIIACKYNNNDAFDYLLQTPMLPIFSCFSDPNDSFVSMEYQLRKCFYTACASGNMDIAQRLFKALDNKRNFMALQFGCKNNQLEIVKFLLKKSTLEKY